jgi:methionyl-tRNA formyltransferase
MSVTNARPLRVLLFGDGLWAAESFLRLRDEGHNVLGVVIRHQPSDPSLCEQAQKLDVPVLQPQDVNAPDFVARASGFSPDLNISISYNQILRKPILRTARLGFINFHAGKLPFYRGRNVINWAIINGEKEIGLTGHFVDEGIDTGDIILQKTLPIGWTETYGDVLDKVIKAFPGIVAETVNLIASGTANPWPQRELAGTYVPGREEGDEWLDWSDISLNLYNKIRAITRPGPGSRTLLGDDIVTIWSAEYDPAWPKYIATPGVVVGRDGHGVMVKTGDSALRILEMQIGDGPVQTPTWRIGTRLGINIRDALQTVLARLKELENQFSGRTSND